MCRAAQQIPCSAAQQILIPQTPVHTAELEETLNIVTNGSLNGTAEEIFDAANDIQMPKRVFEESLDRFSKEAFRGGGY